MSTIVAISTAPGIGGIGIIRMSGKESFSILNKIFVSKKQGTEKGYTLKYGKIKDPKTKDIIDEVLVSFFLAPHSYTTENMCEINSHGGSVIMRKILELCLENGAQLAQPGEFTKRAFLNGRIDLSQAESVIDIIQSKTEKESQAAMQQLQGALSEEIRIIRNQAMNLLVDIEASIDYPEYDIEEVSSKKASIMLEQIIEKLEKLRGSFDSGKLIKEGIKVAIIGKPNVGKSSLLNAILKEDRAIVTEYEGTTRDMIEEIINIEGIPLKIIDTAGIRKAQDKVEQIGIERSRQMTKQADLILAMFDGSKGIDYQDREVLELIKDKNAIIILNKRDLGKKIKDWTEIQSIEKPIIEISALQKEGIEQISEQIKQMFHFNKIQPQEGILVTNVRHKQFITAALDSAKKAHQSVKEKAPIDLSAIYIKEILENLGSITGETVSEGMIKEIFSKFCLGK